MSTSEGAFWQDLQEDLHDPKKLRDYMVASARIATIDQIINELDSARESAHLTKAELARAMNVQPAVVRHLLTHKRVNPTLGTLSELAAVLGLKLTLAPIEEESKIESTPLVEQADHKSAVQHNPRKRVQEQKEPTLSAR